MPLGAARRGWRRRRQVNSADLATSFSGHNLPPVKRCSSVFLRLQAAGDMLGGNVNGVTDSLRKQLARSECVEVAGCGNALIDADALIIVNE